MLFRILVIGAPLTGKTSLISAFFFDGPGASKLENDCVFRASVNLMDGSEASVQTIEVSYNSQMPKSRREKLFNGCHLVLICFDVSNRKSFEVVSDILRDCSMFMSMPAPIYLIGCMSDLYHEVPFEEALSFAQESNHWYATLPLRYLCSLTQDLSFFLKELMQLTISYQSTPVKGLLRRSQTFAEPGGLYEKLGPAGGMVPTELRERILKILHTPVPLRSDSPRLRFSKSSYISHDRSEYSRPQIIAEDFGFLLTQAGFLLSPKHQPNMEERKRSLELLRTITLLLDEFSALCLAHAQATILTGAHLRAHSFMTDNGLLFRVLDPLQRQIGLSEVRTYHHVLAKLFSSALQPCLVMPLVTMVELQGVTFLIKTALPPNLSCVYDPSQGLSNSPILEGYLKNLGRDLNLAIPHWGEKEACQKFPLYSGVEARGYAVPAPGSLLYIDFNADLFPRIGPDSAARLRPEAVATFNSPLSPNAFHAVVHHDPIVNDQVSSLLHEQFAAGFSALAPSIDALPPDVESILTLVHSFGINFSSLGAIYPLLQSELHSDLILIEILVRGFRDLASIAFSRLGPTVLSAGRKEASDLLNQYFTQNEDSLGRWMEFGPRLARRYNMAALQETPFIRSLFARLFTLPSSPPTFAHRLFKRLSKVLPFRFSPFFEMQLETAPKWDIPHRFEELDIDPAFPGRIKVNPFAEMAKAALYLERASKTPVKNRKELLHAARACLISSRHALPNLPSSLLALLDIDKQDPHFCPQAVPALVDAMRRLTNIPPLLAPLVSYQLARWYWKREQQVELAHEHFIKSLEQEPCNAAVLRNYAHFLKRLDKQLAKKIKVRSESISGKSSTPLRQRSHRSLPRSKTNIVIPLPTCGTESPTLPGESSEASASTSSPSSARQHNEIKHQRHRSLTRPQPSLSSPHAGLTSSSTDPTILPDTALRLRSLTLDESNRREKSTWKSLFTPRSSFLTPRSSLSLRKKSVDSSS